MANDQLQSTRASASTLVERLNNAKEFTELKSAVLDFITSMDGGEAHVLGDTDFAALFEAALLRRGKTVQRDAFLMLKVARAAKAGK
jgi:hypothetical protein